MRARTQRVLARGCAAGARSGTRPRVRAASAPAWGGPSSGSSCSSPCCSSREAERAAEVQQLRLGQRLPASGASGRLKLDKLILGPSWRLRAGRGKREMAQSIGWRREQGASCGCTSASCSPRDGIPGARRRRGERAERAERVSPDEADFSLYPSSRVSRPLPPGKIIIKENNNNKARLEAVMLLLCPTPLLRGATTCLRFTLLSGVQVGASRCANLGRRQLAHRMK